METIKISPYSPNPMGPSYWLSFNLEARKESFLWDFAPLENCAFINMNRPEEPKEV
jgi:hypothetical protein